MTVEQYLSNVSPEQKQHYERIKKIVAQLVTDFEETISYGIPTFKHKGKYVIYFGAFKDHMSVFPITSHEVRDMVKDFKTAKGTVRFTNDKPVPGAVIKQIIKDRLKAIG